MKILIVKDRISKEELEEIAKEFYVDMIKGVVDIENKVVAFGGEYHIDASNKLNSLGYSQKNIWGFNIYLNEPKDKWLEYISLINIKVPRSRAPRYCGTRSARAISPHSGEVLTYISSSARK